MSKRLVGAESAVVLAPQAAGNAVRAGGLLRQRGGGALGTHAVGRPPGAARRSSRKGKPALAPADLGLPESETKPQAVVPLSRNQNLLGVLLVVKPSGQPFTPADLQVLFMVAQHATLSLENARRFEDAQRWAISDGLTGLVNHRHFQERLRQEVAEAQRYHTPLAMIMMDVDYFKRLNDTEGHPRGDALLRAVAEIIQGQCRRSDVLARYGGDEFAVIATQTTAPQAAILADRIRAGVEALSCGGRLAAGHAITVSAGRGGLSRPRGLGERSWWMPRTAPWRPPSRRAATTW